MTASQALAAEDLDLRVLAPTERDAVLAWLDEGLRDGRKGRLAAEYPTLLDPERAAVHRIAWIGDAPAAHAVSRVVTVRVKDVQLRLGMIGLVYTDPRFRRRGLASACVEACVGDLHETGAVAAVLWSDRHAFYRRLGFAPAGRESLMRVDRRLCAAAVDRFGPVDETGPARSDEWPALESLLAGTQSHVVRQPGDLARLAASPDCTLRVARLGGRPVAYAACGRGDDFSGVVHEWAGSADGVSACIASLVETRGDVLVLSGPTPAQPIPALQAAGAVTFPGALGLFRLLDPAGLFRSVTGSHPVLAGSGLGGSPETPWFSAAGRRVALDPPDVLSLAIGPEIPRSLRRALPLELSRATRAALPVPLFLWGFDSI